MSPNDNGRPKPGHDPKIPSGYEVGYRRPPREHQFQKGEPSRNPKGRPRGAKRRTPNLVGTLLQPTTLRIQGKELKVPFPEALIQVVKSKALQGNQRAAQMLVNLMREFGVFKPQEELDLPIINIHFVSPRKTEATVQQHPPSDFPEEAPPSAPE